jgi:hypothetical protein
MPKIQGSNGKWYEGTVKDGRIWTAKGNTGVAPYEAPKKTLLTEIASPEDYAYARAHPDRFVIPGETITDASTAIAGRGQGGGKTTGVEPPIYAPESQSGIPPEALARSGVPPEAQREHAAWLARQTSGVPQEAQSTTIPPELSAGGAAPGQPQGATKQAGAAKAEQSGAGVLQQLAQEILSLGGGGTLLGAAKAGPTGAEKPGVPGQGKVTGPDWSTVAGAAVGGVAGALGEGAIGAAVGGVASQALGGGGPAGAPKETAIQPMPTLARWDRMYPVMDASGNPTGQYYRIMSGSSAPIGTDPWWSRNRQMQIAPGVWATITSSEAYAYALSLEGSQPQGTGSYGGQTTGTKGYGGFGGGYGGSGSGSSQYAFQLGLINWRI